MLGRARKPTFDVVKSRPKVRATARVYAIGDIHGRYDLMMALLAKIIDDAHTFCDGRSVRLVFLGDYIDRGDHSAEVLEALKRLSDEPATRTTILRGNHEEALLRFLASPVAGKGWLAFGAQQTLASYGVRHISRDPSDNELRDTALALTDAMGDHIALLKSMPCNADDGEVTFTHAGVDPADAHSMRNEAAMLWGHPSSSTDWPLPQRIVVHGHYDGQHPVDRPGRICVDTGAYYSGTLTAVRLDSAVSFLSVCGA